MNRKKNSIVLLASVSMISGMFSMECHAQDKEEYRVGITIQSLSNSYWDGVFRQVDQILQKKGWDYNILSCYDDASEQISQIKSFIQWDCDLIMVHPSDSEAIEDICRQAKEQGIKVMCWDDDMENSDMNWVLDNEEIGELIGKAAAEFINENYDGKEKIQTVVINYPQTEVLKIREDSILKVLEKNAEGKYEIIAREPAIEPGPALAKMEAVLSEYPECKVVCSIGAGGSIGANEAFNNLFKGNIPEDVGIFSADETKDQVQAIADHEATRAIIGMEGSSLKTAEAVIKQYEALLSGKEAEKITVVRPLIQIDENNVDDILAEY